MVFFNICRSKFFPSKDSNPHWRCKVKTNVSSLVVCGVNVADTCFIFLCFSLSHETEFLSYWLLHLIAAILVHQKLFQLKCSFNNCFRLTWFSGMCFNKKNTRFINFHRANCAAFWWVFITSCSSYWFLINYNLQKFYAEDSI